MSLKGIWNAFKMWQLLKQAAKDAKQEVKIMDEVKPGWKTTEFWVTTLASVMTLIQSMQGTIPHPWGEVAVAVMTAAYSIARAISKKPA